MKKHNQSKRIQRIIFGAFILFMMNVTATFAQLKVSGVVTDSKKEPLIGVNIKVVGTKTGTISDVNGQFSVSVPNSKSVIAFSYIGFKPVVQVVENNKQFTIIMEEDTKNIDEVVVVAYGTQQKSHLTGAVSSIKSDKMEDIPVSRVDQALQGKLAGVNIQQTDPLAGEAPVIRVRGMGSISAAVTPLVVVDGVPIPDGLASVSMGDVESIEVLKDAASASMYGSRAAGGVILVTTKSGNINKPKYNFKMYSGTRNALKLPQLMNQSEYVQLFYDEAALRMKDPLVDGIAYNASTAPNSMKYNLLPDADKAGWLIEHYLIDQPTDWTKEALRENGSNQSYALSASGGDKNIKYFISGNYQSEDGIMRFSSYDKYSLRAKIDINLSKAVSIGINISPSYSNQIKPAVNLTNFIRYPSWLPVKHNAATAALTGKTVGDYAQASDFNSVNISGAGLNGEYWNVVGASVSGSTVQQPVSQNERTKISTDDYRLNSSAYMTINIIPGLQFKTSNSVYAAYKEYNNKQQTGAASSGVPNTLTRQMTFHTELLTENTLNYNKKIGDHSFTGLLGATYQQTSNKYNQIVATGFPDEQILSYNYATSLIMDVPATSTTPAIPGVTSLYYTEAMESFIGRLIYDYKGKYLFSASVRTDGSSKFAEGHKWGTFPAASLGWRMSEENFMKQFDWLSNLKLRASYGLTGNNNIPQYSYMNTLNSSNYDLGVSNGNLVGGLASSDDFLGNINITWEQTEEKNFGIDLGLFNSRINLSVEYYNSNTIQLLLQQPSMYITGHKTYWNNIGKVNNQGLEFELTTTNIDSKKFTWKTTANLSTNKNTLLDYGGRSYQDNFGERSEVYRAIVGQPSIQYFGYKSDGVWSTFTEVAAAKAVTDANGVAFNYTKFAPLVGGLKVVNTNGDNTIDPLDRVVLGSPFPDFTYGITNTFSYDGFDLSFLFQGVQGGKLIDGNMNYNESLRINKAYTANRWVSPSYPGDGKTTYDKTTSGGDLELTDYVMQDASYCALRDFTFGYRVPAKIIRSIGLSQFRVYFSGANLLYIMGSNYKGVNPEARMNTGPYSSSFPLVDGYQRGAFPLNRTYTFGVDINF